MKRLIARAIVPAATLAAILVQSGRFQASQEFRRPDRVRYEVVHLSSLGGTSSRGNSINAEGWVAGFSSLPGNTSRHATLWARGFMVDLGTLGGDNSLATGANNRHQVVGWAENTVHDPTCEAPQILQFRAVVWGPGDQQMVELPPLRGTGDTSTAATAINDAGQVVGISGTCDQAVGRRTATHAVLWERGRIIDLGNLGAELWNTPMALAVVTRPREPADVLDEADRGSREHGPTGVQGR